VPGSLRGDADDQPHQAFILRHWLPPRRELRTAGNLP
jgi:hypothetical protein